MVKWLFLLFPDPDNIATTVTESGSERLLQDESDNNSSLYLGGSVVAAGDEIVPVLPLEPDVGDQLGVRRDGVLDIPLPVTIQPR